MSERIEQLLSSDVFLALVTKNYLKDVREGNIELKEQIAVAREYGKPSFLIYMDLSEEEQKEADKLFKEHKVIKKFNTTRERYRQELPLFAKEMRDWCEEHEAS